MAATIALAAIALGTGIYGMIKSNKEKKAAAQQLKNLERPKATISERDIDNQRIIESMASRGLSPQARSIAQRDYERGLSASINAMNTAGASPSEIAPAYRNYLDKVDRLTLLDEQARINNINNYISQNRRMADQDFQRWSINEYAPYVDKAAFLNQQYMQANQDFNSSMGLAAQGASSAVGGFSRMSATNKAAGGQGFGGLRQSPGARADNSSAIGLSSNVSSGATAGPAIDTGFKMYSPSTSQPVSQIDWTLIRPENRSSLYQLYSGG